MLFLVTFYRTKLNFVATYFMVLVWNFDMCVCGKDSIEGNNKEKSVLGVGQAHFFGLLLFGDALLICDHSSQYSYSPPFDFSRII